MKMTTTNINDNDRDSGVLNYHQVSRLDSVLNDTMDICGVCGLPRISVTIKDFILKLKHEFNRNQFPIIDIRLNGGAAAAVLDPHGTYQFNDIDLLVGFDSFPSYDNDLYFNDTIRVVLSVIEELLQPMSESTATLFRSQKLSYIQKLIRIQNATNGDSWSLLSLGGGRGGLEDRSRKIDIKFTQSIQRQFEFSIDSFQIVIDSLLTFYEALCTFSSSNVRITENFYPTVSVFSKWPSLSEALTHLDHRQIVTTLPEKIRGGGLLKYCKLIVQGFSVPHDCNVSRLERYMCSRFFIDYADLESQKKAIEGFLTNHFPSIVGKKFLEKLHYVISSSSVCLMKHERHQVLQLVRDLIVAVNGVYSVPITNNQRLVFANHSLQSSSSNGGGSTVMVNLTDSSWTMDLVVSDNVMPNNLHYNSRSSSTVTFWSTPTDLSPVDPGE